MLATLDGRGFEAASVEDLLTWVRHDERRVVLLTIQVRRDWSMLAELCRNNPDLVVVAVLADATEEAYVRAILSGAVVAVPRDASPAVVRRMVEEAVNGTSLLPTRVVRALIPAREDHSREAPVEAAGLEWLKALARGTTVAQLAERNGYSERAMFRLLRALYERMGVKGRTEALMLANRRGWL
jgi:DNA-binding NarL/FixJ family response regulator